MKLDFSLEANDSFFNMVSLPCSFPLFLGLIFVCSVSSCKKNPGHARFTSASSIDDIKKSLDSAEPADPKAPPASAASAASTGAASGSAATFVPKKQKAKRPPVPPKPELAHHVVFCQDNCQEYYHVVQNEVLGLKLAKEKDIALTIYDGYGSSERQIEQIRYATLGKPDAILITPHEGAKLAGIAAEARKAGIKVIAVENPLPEEAADAQFLMDNGQAGQLAGEVIVQAMERKAQEFQQPAVTGRVVELMGQTEGDTSLLRHQGFIRALAKEPGLIVVHEAPGYWNHADAKERMKEAMKLQKPVEVVYAHNDAMLVGAYQAAEDAALQQELLFVGTGGLPGLNGGLKNVVDRTVNFTISLPLLTDLAADAVIQMIRSPNAAAPVKQVVPVELVTARNAAEIEEKRSAALRALGK